MHFKLVSVFMLVLLAGCAVASAELTSQDRALATAAGVDIPIAQRVRPFGLSMERLMATTADYDETPAAGIVLSVKPKEGRAVLERIRAELADTGYSAYLYDDAFGTGPDKIAVLKADDLGYLALVRTDGINYDIDHEKVMAKYAEWNKKYGLKLVGAGQDWLEAEYTHPPADWDAFAAEVYAFCPDVVDQGTNTVAALAKEMKANNYLYLWWD